MTLAALHLSHRSIDRHGVEQTGGGCTRGPSGSPGERHNGEANPGPSAERRTNLAEREARDGGAPLGWRASRVAGCFGVQQERAEFKSPVVAPARSGGRGTPRNVIAGAAPSEGAPARAKEQTLD